MPTEWMPRVKGIEEQINAERLKLWLRRQPSVVESAPPEVLAASTPLPTTTREPTEWSPRMIAESAVVQPRIRQPITPEMPEPEQITRRPITPITRAPVAVKEAPVVEEIPI